MGTGKIIKKIVLIINSYVFRPMWLNFSRWGISATNCALIYVPCRPLRQRSKMPMGYWHTCRLQKLIKRHKSRMSCQRGIPWMSFFLERICQMLEKFCRRNVVHPRKPASKIDTFTLQQPFHALCIPFVIQQTILLLVSICFQIWLPQLDKRRRKDWNYGSTAFERDMF